MTITDANAVARLLRFATGQRADGDTAERIRDDVAHLEERISKALQLTFRVDPHALDAAIHLNIEGIHR